jgi:hypothetical protein
LSQLFEPSSGRATMFHLISSPIAVSSGSR